jgi:threonine dehydratase
MINQETRSITEPAGALALAGLKRYIIQNNLVGANKRLVAVVSGANMNFDRLRFVAERAELGEGREALLCAEIPEKAGRCVQKNLSAPWISPVDRPLTASSLCIAS